MYLEGIRQESEQYTEREELLIKTKMSPSLHVRICNLNKQACLQYCASFLFEIGLKKITQNSLRAISAFNSCSKFLSKLRKLMNLISSKLPEETKAFQQKAISHLYIQLCTP